MEILGTDLFEIKGRNFIILSDYYSKFPIVKELRVPVTTVAVTVAIEEACSMFRSDQTTDRSMRMSTLGSSA